MTRYRPMICKSWLGDQIFDDLIGTIKTGKRWKGGFAGVILSKGLAQSRGYEEEWQMSMEDSYLERQQQEKRNES